MSKEDIFYSKIALLIICTVGVYHGIFAAVFLLIFESWKTYLIFIGVHVAVTIAFYAAGDFLTTFTAGGRRSREFMEDEKYLKDLYTEILTHAKNGTAGRKIYFTPALYIADSVDFNAFALHEGIVMNKGIMTSISPDEQKGVIAHELGHILDGYPHLLTFLRGSMFIGSFILFLYEYSKKLTGVRVKSKDIDLSFNYGSIFYVIFDILLLLPALYFKVISAPCFRAFELRADEYAIKLGYGEELKRALKMSYHFDLMRKYTLLDRLMATHPLTARRIAFIENYGSKYTPSTTATRHTSAAAAPTSIIPAKYQGIIKKAFKPLSIATSCAVLLYFVFYFHFFLHWKLVPGLYLHAHETIFNIRFNVSFNSIEKIVSYLSLILGYATIPLILLNITCLIWQTDENYFIKKYKKHAFDTLIRTNIITTTIFFAINGILTPWVIETPAWLLNISFYYFGQHAYALGITPHLILCIVLLLSITTLITHHIRHDT